MIEVTKFDGSECYLNPHQIEFVEINPDTTICLVSGKRIIVKETASEIKDRVIAHYTQIGKIKTE